MTILNVDDDMEKLDHSYIASENVRYIHSESLAVSLKIKHVVTIKQLCSWAFIPPK